MWGLYLLILITLIILAVLSARVLSTCLKCNRTHVPLLAKLHIFSYFCPAFPLSSYCKSHWKQMANNHATDLLPCCYEISSTKSPWLLNLASLREEYRQMLCQNVTWVVLILMEHLSFLKLYARGSCCPHFHHFSGLLNTYWNSLLGSAYSIQELLYRETLKSLCPFL